MSWLGDLLSGDGGSPDGGERDRDARVRAAQLRKGVESAAAAVEERHPGAARSAVEAADRLVRRVPGANPSVYDEHDRGHERPGEEGLAGDLAGGERARELAREAVERMDRLHFALLRVSVQGDDPGEAGVAEAVEAVERAAEELAPGGEDGSGAEEET